MAYELESYDFDVNLKGFYGMGESHLISDERSGKHIEGWGYWAWKNG